jgi:TonB-linked SusC/RagA family outer membrane protein
MNEKVIIKKKTLRAMIIAVCVLCSTFSLYAQRTVSGTVTDVDDQPIAGANVAVKGTSVGTATGVNGTYLLNVQDNDVLVFSYVGYVTQEITVTSQTVVSVKLQEDLQSMEEVVIVGYGTQKKINLTGSVATIDSKELLVRPVTNGAALLQGRVAGLNITQNSGQPGAEGFSINLRGIGSFSNSAPFVLIDGIEGSLEQINPEDVENVSILKDAASASIYGSRASNGVILITTKKGRQDFREIDVKVEIGAQNVTRLPDYIYNSVEYMEMWNKSAEHSDINTRYPKEMIEAYRNASPGDPRYPNYNWTDAMYNMALRQNYQVTARGGGKNNTFYFGLGYTDQGSIIDRYNTKLYSGRLNLDFQPNQYVKVGTNNSFVHSHTEESMADSQTEMILYIQTMPPTMTPQLSDGSGRYTARDIPEIWRNRNPQMILDNEGHNLLNKYTLNTQAYVEILPFKGLSWKTTGAWRWYQNRKFHSAYLTEGYTFSTNEYYGMFEGNSTGIYRNNEWISTLVFNSILNYQTTIAGKHNLSAIAGYEQETMDYETERIRRQGYTTSTTTDINAGSASGQEVSGRTTRWVLQSYFGRINYDFKNRYLLELNIRYDATSKLASENRWSVFPSASAGWRISEEGFMKDVAWLDNLKIRFSAGQLGNQNALSEYPYQEALSYVSIPIQGSLQTGVKSENLANRSLTWETVTDYTLGTDFSILRGLLGITLDVYQRTTKGGHATAQIPASVGKNAPQDNYKEMENKGIELMMTHKGKIGEVRYDVGLIFDKYWNKITKIKDNSWSRRSQVAGHPFEEYYLLDWTGIYQNQNEINTLPVYEPYKNQIKPGDLVIADLNNDGEITFTPETGDKIFMSGRHPKFSYSLDINVGWKNFDLSMFWQGIAGRKIYIDYIGREPFSQGTPPTTRWRNAWDGEGSTNSMPALYNMINYGYNPISGYDSDFYFEDVSYLRLKNLQIGYTVPGKLCSKIGFKKVRVYATGDNIFTFSPYEGEPERVDNSMMTIFPQLRTFTFGLNVTF